MNTYVQRLYEQLSTLAKRVFALEQATMVAVPTSIKLVGDDGKTYTITIKNKTLNVS